MSDKNTDDGNNLANLMMKNIVDFGRYSFELEEKREQSLLNQSTQMLTAFSVFSVALLMILPVIIDINNELTGRLLFCTVIVSLPLVTSLILALLAQWRYKQDTLRDIEVFYNEINDNHKDYQAQVQFDFQWKEQFRQVHNSKKGVNDKRVKLIIASMIMFFIAIGAVLLSFIGIVFSIL